MAGKRPASSSVSKESVAPAPPFAMVPLSLPSLPLPLFSLVLEFSLYNFTQELRPHGRYLPVKYLKDVALVARSWYQVVDELVARCRRDTMQLTLKFGSRAEVLAIRRQVQLRGRAVRDLRVRMGRSDGTRFVAEVWWWIENREVPWDVIFSQMQGLKRLDLRFMPLESRHLPILLQMGAKYCLQLEMLVLPRKHDMASMVNCAAVRQVMEVLREAIERWHLKGKCGGLKQLTVPTREEEDRFRTSTAFITDVIKFCPNVEYLDGYTHAIDEINDVTCDEMWMISLDTWEKFNRTCTNLRDFHWAVVPLADPFFRVFGEHVKPKLKKLSLTSNLAWNWGDYFKMDSTSGLPAEKPGYGLLANDVVALLKGCPALTELQIAIDQEKNEEALVTLFDADVFRDKFWRAREPRCEANPNILYCGLLALAEHTCLATMELSAVCCSGDGVFKFLRHIFNANNYAGGKRSVELSLAGPNDYDTTLSHPFYLELVTLLKRVADISEEELGATSCNHKASVNIRNSHSFSVDKEWSISYVRNELKPLMKRVASAHPALDLHIVLCRDGEDSFHRIDSLELDWRPGFQQGDMFIEDEFIGDNEGSDEDEEVFDDEEDDGPVDPQEYFLRGHPLFMDDDYEVVPADEVDDAE